MFSRGARRRLPLVVFWLLNYKIIKFIIQKLILITGYLLFYPTWQVNQSGSFSFGLSGNRTGAQTIATHRQSIAKHEEKSDVLTQLAVYEGGGEVNRADKQRHCGSEIRALWPAGQTKARCSPGFPVLFPVLFINLTRGSCQEFTAVLLSTSAAASSLSPARYQSQPVVSQGLTSRPISHTRTPVDMNPELSMTSPSGPTKKKTPSTVSPRWCPDMCCPG